MIFEEFIGVRATGSASACKSTTSPEAGETAFVSGGVMWVCGVLEDSCGMVGSGVFAGKMKNRATAATTIAPRIIGSLTPLLRLGLDVVTMDGIARCPVNVFREKNETPKVRTLGVSVSELVRDCHAN